MLGISEPRSIVTVFGVVYALLSFGASSADAVKPQPSTIIDDNIPHANRCSCIISSTPFCCRNDASDFSTFKRSGQSTLEGVLALGH
jgi:hypothetical protein